MTRKVYWEDSYIRKFQATVIDASDESVILDRTAFYPAGGGQPADTGIITAGGTVFKVTDTRKAGEDVSHFVSGFSGKIGDIVGGEIDWDRRYQHMKYHTAIHLIDAVVNRNPEYAGIITGSQIYEDRARVDFALEGFSMEQANEFIRQSNLIIGEKHPVRSYFISAEEAAGIENLARTAPGRDLLKTMDKVRIVEIEGIDRQADGGTHVSSLAEIGKITLSKIENKGRNNKRMVIVLESGGE